MTDYDIRQQLLIHLKVQHSAESDCLIVEELGLAQGESRVDVALINGSLNGFEIKSNRDRLDRLPRQRDMYGRFFDTMTIVVGDKHLQNARIVVPAWWGIIEARLESNDIQLRSRRQPRPNRGIDPRSVVQLLWKHEACEIATQLGIPRPKSRTDAWELIASSLCREELCKKVREALKARGDWRSGPTPFRRGGSPQSVASAQRSRANLHWLLSRGSRNRPH
jgi:hypothetical protein